jgi:hypothetical protein
MLLAGVARRCGSGRWCNGGLPQLGWAWAAITGGNPGTATAHGHQAGRGKKKSNAGTIQGSRSVEDAILGRWLPQLRQGRHRWLCH